MEIRESITCLEEKEVIIFDCQHFVCENCLEKIKKKCNCKCPMCRTAIKINNQIVKPFRTRKPSNRNHLPNLPDYNEVAHIEDPQHLMNNYREWAEIDHQIQRTLDDIEQLRLL